MKSQGIDLLEDEMVGNQQKKSRSPSQKVIVSKPKRFLDDDGQVLKQVYDFEFQLNDTSIKIDIKFRFDAIWDDTKSEHGELRKYKILYYPFDSSVAIKVIDHSNIFSITIIYAKNTSILGISCKKWWT